MEEELFFVLLRGSLVFVLVLLLLFFFFFRLFFFPCICACLRTDRTRTKTPRKRSVPVIPAVVSPKLCLRVVQTLLFFFSFQILQILRQTLLKAAKESLRVVEKSGEFCVPS
jgi:hypothetical protein